MSTDFTGNIYFVNKGPLFGTFLIPVEIKGDKICILELPNTKAVEIPLSDFEKALEDEIVEFGEILPIDVYDVCKLQYSNMLKKIDK